MPSSYDSNEREYPVLEPMSRRSLFAGVAAQGLTVALVVTLAIAIGGGAGYGFYTATSSPGPESPSEFAAPAHPADPFPTAASEEGTLLPLVAARPSTPLMLVPSASLPNDALVGEAVRVALPEADRQAAVARLLAALGPSDPAAMSDEGLPPLSALDVRADEVGSFSYLDGSPARVCPPAGGSSLVEGVGPVCADSGTQGESFTSGQALSAARSLTAEIRGTREETFAWEVSEDSSALTVAGTLTVGSVPVPLRFVYRFGVDGSLRAVSGFLGRAQQGEPVEMLGAYDAVTRAQRVPWSALVTERKSVSSDGTPSGAGSLTAEETAARGSVVAIPVDRQLVTQAVAGSFVYVEPSGAVTVLPSWTVSTAGSGRSWDVLAVPSAQVAFVSNSER